MTTREILSPLPDKGWGVIRCNPVAMMILAGAGYIKVQLVSPGVYQARLTGPGKEYRNSL